MVGRLGLRLSCRLCSRKQLLRHEAVRIPVAWWHAIQHQATMSNWTPLGAGRKLCVVTTRSKLLLQAPRAQSQNGDEMLLNQMTPLEKEINPDRAALPNAKSSG